MVSGKGKGRPTVKKVSAAPEGKVAGNAPASTGAGGAAEAKVAAAARAPAENMAKGVADAATPAKAGPATETPAVAPAAETILSGAPSAATGSTGGDVPAFQNSIMGYMARRAAVLQAGREQSIKILAKEQTQDIAQVKAALRPEADEPGTPARRQKRMARHQALLESLRKEEEAIAQALQNKPQLR